MGLFVNQQDQRSELQERIAAELREKAKASSLQEKATMDGVDDIRYLEGTKQTTTLAWAWILIAIMAGVVIVMFLMQGR
ncbi:MULTISPECIES: hypothetical protein [Candidatus Saccharimonadota]|jgi:hypothetical protein|uniref:hypothetical protein n=1 Tax=Candidatus Saccharimonadota TaxID=95818 RepID=UPI001E3CB711|nr:hypothetical protein [Candidatus Nanosynbacter sp. HMT-352]MCC9312961.1 hypothetical protein [Candidatus Nanosynbacter sp.]UHA57118.1 hypothetical protein LR957_02190 [Candidatus Nanosynbacter sp. HMT-352]UOG67393.1 hypothetical protein LRM49_01220 [Candidatus Nanosynbacter sp. HMT-352]